MQVDWIRSSFLPSGYNIFDDIRGTTAQATPNLFELTKFQTPEPLDEVIEDYGYVNFYLQYGNEIIKNLADTIVNERDSDDEKIEKIQRWVVENIVYEEDEPQYGISELWVPPVMLLSTMKGDCEDGAFLIMSLALNAGVDPDKLRFYAGIVEVGKGAATGGHGWVAYQRSIDQEWVPIDFSYYPDLRPMNERMPMKDDTRYIDDFLLFDIGRIILTPDTNRVRNPEMYNYYGNIEPNILRPGSWLNHYA